MLVSKSNVAMLKLCHDCWEYSRSTRVLEKEGAVKYLKPRMNFILRMQAILRRGAVRRWRLTMAELQRLPELIGNFDLRTGEAVLFKGFSTWTQQTSELKRQRVVMHKIVARINIKSKAFEAWQLLIVCARKALGLLSPSHKRTDQECRQMRFPFGGIITRAEYEALYLPQGDLQEENFVEELTGQSDCDDVTEEEEYKRAQMALNRCKFEASKCATIFCRIRSQSSLPLPCPTLPLSVRPCDTASPGSIPLSFAESFECGEAEKLKRAKDRWGIVPVDILEGQATPMLTACVRETLKERKEAQSELKKQLQDKGDGGIRLCVHPVIISTTNGFPLMLSLLVIVFVATKEHVVQLKRQKFLDKYKYTSTNVGKSS